MYSINHYKSKLHSLPSSGKNILLLLQCQESLFVMSRNHPASSCSFQALETLSALEPCWVISSKPALRNTISPLFNISNVFDSQEEENSHSR